MGRVLVDVNRDGVEQLARKTLTNVQDRLMTVNTTVQTQLEVSLVHVQQDLD
jgi:hypothetical protein